MNSTPHHDWGLTELEIDRDLLSLGSLGVQRVRGKFRDGTSFAAPETDALPELICVLPA